MMDKGSGLHPQVLRGLQLRDLGRYPDAERAFREALGENPRDAFVLNQLAGCLYHEGERRPEALRAVSDAIALEPEEAEHHVLRAFILCSMQRPVEGRAAAEQALRFDPYSSMSFCAQAQADLQLERWADAEASARQSLAMDADNSIAANQLAQALRLQNKAAENREHLSGLLERDPEDPFTHANAGWAALQGGSHRQAEIHFREALRLDPGYDHAREGLLNSFRARSWFYRAYLKYSFWMQRVGTGARWGVILGLYLAMQVGRRIFTGPHAWIGVLVVVIYFLLVLWVWVAKPVGNFILLFDRSARHALRRPETTEAVVVGIGVFGGIALFVVGQVFDWFAPVLLGPALVAASFPLSLTFTNGSRTGSLLFGGLGALMILAGIIVVLPILPDGAAVFLYIGALIACLASTWLGNVPALRREQ